MKKTILSTALLTFLVSAQFAIAQDQLDAKQTKFNSNKKILWAMIDTNNDEKISKEEFLAAELFNKKAERIFAKKDLNKDGVITKEEIKKLYKERKRKFLRFNQKQIEIQPQQEAQKETYDFSQ